MNYDEKLQNVTVLGAAGKMGSGILLLTAVEMADLSLKPENKGKTFVLNAVDVSSDGLSGLMKYLEKQVLKIAEKKTVLLRRWYANREDLVENAEIIDQYVFDVLNIVRPGTAVEAAYNSSLIFEAVNENKDLKVRIFSQIDKNNPHKPWYFTNTSSVPIHIIDHEAGLEGRILGVHFYNPPAVQKLVELIATDETKPEMTEFARAFARNLKKVIVPSHDVAGFIGNGHFIRDALHGINEAIHLSKDRPLVEAIYMINRVSQDFLVRPMGIFQLIDYVGVDVVQFIMRVMNPFLKDEDLHSDVLDKLMDLGIKGGQYSDGTQKDGFLKYEKGKPVAVFDPDKKDYVPVSGFRERCDAALGPLPQSYKPWKVVCFSRDKKDAILKSCFDDMHTMQTLGAQLAKTYGSRSKEIGKKLVADNVAFSEADVNTVLLMGFYHAYGPINDYFD
jgi:3-hydroxyacyl-CoA dehydrogenase